MPKNYGRDPEQMRRLRKAVKHRAELLDQDMFSIPESEGAVAIFFSVDTALRDEKLAKEHLVLERHARQLEQRYSKNQSVIIIDQPDVPQVEEVMANPDVSSVVVLGHGRFGNYHVYIDGPELKYVDWSTMGKMATHLKTGFFEQRTCAGFGETQEQMRGEKPATVRVALGSFVLADQSRNFAPVGYDPERQEGTLSDFDRLLHPVYELPNNSVEQLLTPIVKIPGVKRPDLIRDNPS